MSTLYGTLRRGLQVAADLYYVDIEMTGRSRIPEEHPVIFAANHPNSIMDSVILGTQIDRQVHYLAKSELFANPLVARLFDACGVIPLHRNPEGDSTNEEAFASAFRLLESGRCLGIFPEGRNSLERGLLKIKTGTARIALGVEQRNDYRLGVRIVPVGLNFENRDQFMSRVVVRVGEPIEAADYGGYHRAEPTKAVRDLTDDVGAALRQVVATMADVRVRRLAEQVDRIYGRELIDDMIRYREQKLTEAELQGRVDDRRLVEETTEKNAHRRRMRDRLIEEVKQIDPDEEGGAFDRQLLVQERIGEAIGYYSEEMPELVEELQVRLWRYVDHLDQFRIRGDLSERLPESASRRREAAKLTAYAIVFAVPAMWGFLHNAIPYNLTRLAALQAPDEPMRAFTGLLSGTAIFGLIYAAICWAVWMTTGGEVWTTVGYMASLPVTGFFFLRYRRQVSKYRNRILTRAFVQTRRLLVDALLAERDALIDAFDKLRDHFRAVEEAERRGEEPPEPPEIDLDPYWGP
jgi:1-acyl-sn-glycerol-3-phosphate acyltransferase